MGRLLTFDIAKPFVSYSWSSDTTIPTTLPDGTKIYTTLFTLSTCRCSCLQADISICSQRATVFTVSAQKSKAVAYSLFISVDTDNNAQTRVATRKRPCGKPSNMDVVYPHVLLSGGRIFPLVYNSALVDVCACAAFQDKKATARPFYACDNPALPAD